MATAERKDAMVTWYTYMPFRDPVHKCLRRPEESFIWCGSRILSFRKPRYKYLLVSWFPPRFLIWWLGERVNAETIPFRPDIREAIVGFPLSISSSFHGLSNNLNKNKATKVLATKSCVFFFSVSHLRQRIAPIDVVVRRRQSYKHPSGSANNATNINSSDYAT